MERFRYANYEFGVRNLSVVSEHLAQFTGYFARCHHVIDLGCGSGLFLALLKAAGIRATGIDSDPEITKHAVAHGHNAILGDVSLVWDQLDLDFDGVFCSHLIEHLPFEQVIDLVAGFSSRLQSGGVVVLAFPNPESLEMQLFHFWKDPQHVRFYHHDLIAALLSHYGIELSEAYTQGAWGPFPPVRRPINVGVKPTELPPRPHVLRRGGRFIKRLLGITALEIEADYLRKLRQVGREVVLVGRRR